MKNQDFTAAISVEKTPEEAFDAINNGRGWWSEEIEGGTDKLGDEFTYHYKDVHRCKMKIIELIPRKKSFGLFWTTILISRKTRPSGRAQRSFLRSLKKGIRRKSASLTRV